ncbi:MAG: S1/P1 nuclease [Ichthyobacteriaceae bacterium]|nr:S1/P1 nuclease [Ichthyobacteriaceae bacterium]
MKRFFLTQLMFVFLMSTVFAYGPTGHRTIAKVAEGYLTEKTKKNIMELLGGDSFILASTYADDIKSDSRFDYTHTWHYVNAQDGMSYNDSKKNPKGDLIKAINESIAIIKDKKSTKEDKTFRLKMLIHLIGDLHQPLHTGRASDLGGNRIKVNWFGEPTNLHRLWDSGIIEHSLLSYTEFASTMKKEPYLDVDKIKKGNIISWYTETKKLSYEVYNSVEPDHQDLSYGYNYKYFPVVKNQLNKAGIRLAKILNELFG